MNIMPIGLYFKSTDKRVIHYHTSTVADLITDGTSFSLGIL